MNEQENFAEMLEASMKTLNTGDIVEGVITSISQNEIHLDLGAKTTGVITHDKATNDSSAKLEDLFKVGDVVRAKVVKVSDIDGIATLDKTRVDADANWVAIVNARTVRFWKARSRKLSTAALSSTSAACACSSPRPRPVSRRKATLPPW